MTRPPAVVVGSEDTSAAAMTTSTPLTPRRRQQQNEDRKTNIQVCVRLRPILSSDARRPTTKSSAGLASKLPTPRRKIFGHQSRKSSATSNGSASSTAHHFARTTESSQRHHDDEQQDTRQTASTSSADTTALIPAWEVTTSTLHSNTTTDTIYQNPATNPDPSKKTTYAFDRVFGPATQTTSLYTSSVQDVVRSSMEGYHGSVFAYGQTSTGKTHTMTGTPADPGIVPLAVRDCFRCIRNESESSSSAEGDNDNDNREYLLRVSYMEIYNEQIVDLLAPPPVPGPRGAGAAGAGFGSGPSSSTGGSGIRIFESKAEGVVVRGLKEEVVTSPEQVFSLLATGEQRRRTASTALNHASSRSHSIFRLIVESRASRGGVGGGGGSLGSSPSPVKSGAGDDDSVRSGTSASTSGAAGGGPVRVSSLSLVDLAGSESVKATGSKGARQKEGQFINKSLLTLGHVIYKLSELSAKAEKGGEPGVPANMQMHTKHIPYRDSKLTRLLQPSLSGNAQICIVCNVSPLTRNLEESHNTLKFASRAKKIKQNASINEVVDDRTLLQNYREEIGTLKAQLHEAKLAQVALQKEKDVAAAATPAPPLDENDEDIVSLVSAIQNLEKLILRKNSVAHSETKPDKDASGDAGQEQPRSSKGGSDRTGSFFASGGDFDSLSLLADDDEAETPNARRNLNKSAFSGNVDDDGANENVNASSEDDGLITELHRIQGLLGSVFKKGRPGDVLSPVGENSDVLSPPKTTRLGSSANNSVQNTPDRDEEVELLRSQLKEQEVATSLRKADSSFLQSQLQEKDNLLKEVSKILDALEKRQVELEEENARTRQELSRKNLQLEAQSKEIESLKAGQQDDGLFDDLVG